MTPDQRNEMKAMIPEIENLAEQFQQFDEPPLFMEPMMGVLARMQQMFGDNPEPTVPVEGYYKEEEPTCQE